MNYVCIEPRIAYYFRPYYLILCRLRRQQTALADIPSTSAFLCNNCHLIELAYSMVGVIVIFILSVLADSLIIKIIIWSFGSIVSHNPFAANLLEGIQLLSALGTALAYILYLVRSLFKDAKHVMKEISTESNQEET